MWNDELMSVGGRWGVMKIANIFCTPLSCRLQLVAKIPPHKNAFSSSDELCWNNIQLWNLIKKVNTCFFLLRWKVSHLLGTTFSSSLISFREKSFSILSLESESSHKLPLQTTRRRGCELIQEEGVGAFEIASKVDEKELNFVIFSALHRKWEREGGERDRASFKLNFNAISSECVLMKN